MNQESYVREIITSIEQITVGQQVVYHTGYDLQECPKDLLAFIKDQVLEGRITTLQRRTETPRRNGQEDRTLGVGSLEYFVVRRVSS